MGELGSSHRWKPLVGMLIIYLVAMALLTILQTPGTRPDGGCIGAHLVWNGGGILSS